MKNKIFNRQWTAPLIAFLAVGAVYLLYFALRGFYPFGERSIAWCDMEQQYIPLMMEVRNIVLDGGSVLLGKGGGGMNFWGVFLFFVSSPFVLLSLLIREENIIYFINILTVLKLCCCGASAEFYFQRMFPKMSRSFGILLSVMYSLNGCVMMYYQNNMWLEMMIIFPLLLLSMFRLCQKGRWGAYVLCLSAAMYLNFYISYMIVLFIVISGGLMLIFCCEKRNRSDRAFKFLLADVCAAMITAIVWIPAFRQFTSSGRGSSSAEFFFSGSFFGKGWDKLALLACTSIVFTALAVIFLERKKLKSGRAAYFALITAVMTVGAFIDPINKIWHTGSYQAFPFRYGFMIVLLSMSVCGELFSERTAYRTATEADIRKRHTKILMLLFVFMASAIPVFFYSDNINSYVSTLWLEAKDSIILTSVAVMGALVYLICIRRYCSGKLTKRFTLIVMTCVMLTESLISFNVYFGNTYDVSKRFAQTESLNDRIDDDEYYRVKSTKRYFYTNVLEGLGFSSIGHYTSLTDSDFLFASKRLGYSSYWMDGSVNGGTIITDAFLMNRYFIGTSPDMNGLCELYDDDGVLKIYRNSLISEGAVISEASPQELSEFESIQRMDATELIAEKLYGEADIVQLIEPYDYNNVTRTEDEYGSHFVIDDDSQKATVNYNLFVEGRKELYFDLFSNYSTSLTEPYFGAVSVYVNGRSIEKEYPNKRSNGIVDLGTYEDKHVSIKVVVNKEFYADTFGVYALDVQKAEEGITSTETAGISLDGNKIRITADSDSEGYLYIPFAYSDGYKAKLNGKTTEISRTLGSFMAVKIKEGENELVLTFYPSGFKLGAVISFVGVIVFALLMLLRPKNRKLVKARGVCAKLLMIMSFAAVTVIYVISSVVWIVVNIAFM